MVMDLKPQGDKKTPTEIFLRSLFLAKPQQKNLFQKARKKAVAM